MPNLVGARAVIVEVEPQAGDRNDIVVLAPCTAILGLLSPQAQAEIAVLVQVKVRHGLGGVKPEGLAAGCIEYGEPAGCGVTVQGVFEGLGSHGKLGWCSEPRHVKFPLLLVLLCSVVGFAASVLAGTGAVLFSAFVEADPVGRYPSTQCFFLFSDGENPLAVFRREVWPSGNHGGEVRILGHHRGTT